MSRILIYGCKRVRPTASKLAEKLEADYKEGFVDFPEEYDWIFRYGNSAELRTSREYHSPFKLIENVRSGFFNHPNAIKIACNKLDARMRLIGAGLKALVPKTFSNKEEVLQHGKFPLIARPLYHSQGRHFKVVKNKYELNRIPNDGWYYSSIIEKRDEYRLFVFKKKVIEADKKTKNRDDADMLIRSHRKGWRFKHTPLTTLPRNIIESSIMACAAIGLDFGAVDICDNNDGNCYVLEVNSAPGLIDRKIELLAERFKTFIGKER